MDSLRNISTWKGINILEFKHVTNEKEWEDCLSIRKIVFIEEQQIPVEEEIDEFEKEADHFVLYHEGKPVGAGRFRKFDEYGKVERICVLKETRGTGAGKQIMDGIEQFALAKGITTLKLNAQTHAIPFYEKLGYIVISDEFLDAGIPHKTMKKMM